MHGVPDNRSATSYSKPYFWILLGLSMFSLSIPLSKSASNVLIACIYLGALYGVLSNSSFRSAIKQSFIQPLLLPLAAYLGVALLGRAYSSNMTDGVGIVNKMCGMILIYVMVSTLLDHTEESGSAAHSSGMLLFIFLVGICILDIIGVLTYLGVVGNRKHFLPLSPLNVFHIWFANLNAIGLYIAASIAFFSPLNRSTGIRTVLSLFVPLAAFSILFSLSRTAWLGMVFTLIVLSLLLVRNRKVLYFTFAAVLVAALLMYFFSAIFRSRVDLVVTDVSSYLKGKTETNIGERFLMWKAALQMFLSNPLFGVGTGDYVLTMRSYIDRGEMPQFLLMFNQPHNIYLFALATNGLLGLASLLFIFYKVLTSSLPLLKAEGTERMLAFCAVATTIHYMTAGLTDSLFNIQILRYSFGFIIGVCVRKALRGRNADGFVRRETGPD